MDQEILHTEKILADRKIFFMDLKENQRGRVVKITEDAPAAVDAQLMATWMDVFGVGGLCRFGESAGLLVSFKLSKSLTAVYVAEAPYNTLRIRNFGTHELALRWTVSTPQRVTTNPRFF